jgi:hypothetical protein
MQIKYSLTLRDYRDAQLLHAKRSAMHYLAHCAAHYLYPLVGIAILAFEFTPHHFVGLPRPNLTGTLCGLLLVCVPVYLRWMTKRCFKRTRSGTDACTIDLEQERVQTKGSHTRSEVEWSAFQSSSEDAKIFLLYLAPAKFVVIPKRACTADQVLELRSLLQNNVKNNSFAV